VVTVTIRITNPWILRAAWWRWSVPTYVEAGVGLWLEWFIGYRAARLVMAAAGYWKR
jgi:hypothetical protein